MIATAATGQQPLPRPRLVVGITVEGLDYNMLQLLRSYFGNGGLKKLMDQGVNITSLDYGPNMDAASATAMLYTGAAPQVNGISGSYVYEPSTKRGQHILFDASKIGNFTDETLSPKNIKVSTLADEIRMDAKGVVTSVAPNSHEAIITAGHAGNSAFWINNANGHWATTTYYTDVPRAVTVRNYKTPLSGKIDTMVWTPLLPSSAYGPAIGCTQPSFKYTFRRSDPDGYKKLKLSPKGNGEVTAMASDLLTTLNMGRNPGMDMLNVVYTVAPYVHSGSSDTRMELMDSYLRLDREITKLLNLVESTAGGQNSVVWMAGVPAPPSSRRDDEKWGVPYGQFSARRAMSLLNMYLMAVHGNGDWVSGYFNNHFYLNHNLIKEKELNLSDLRAEAADFLGRMEGVSSTYSIEDVTAARAGDRPEALKRNTVLAHSGDVAIEINPGWEVIEDPSGSTTPNVVKRASSASYPLLLMAPGVASKVETEPVDARAVCPSICRLIRVRSPNAATHTHLLL